MVRIGLFVLIALWSPSIAEALPPGCSTLAAEGNDLWVVEAGHAPRRVVRADQPVVAASWSPSRREIAFSVYPPTTSVANEVVIADIDGRILGRLTIDKPYAVAGGLRVIDALEWPKPQTLVTLAEAGPHGGYMDVWRLAKNYKVADKVRRAIFVGGSCTVSPSVQYLACRGEGRGIVILDTLAPPDEDGVVEDRHPFETPHYGGPEETSEGLESNLAWDSAGLRLYAVSLLNSKRVLTTIEKGSAADTVWRIMDRDLVGVDSAIRHIEVHPNGSLMLGDEGRAYRVVAEKASPRSPAVAEAISAADLRGPQALEIASDRGKLRLKVLDTYCGDTKLKEEDD
jgi:hypothetical protein